MNAMKIVKLIMTVTSIIIPFLCLAKTETVNGISWTYTVTNGKASIGNGTSSAVSPYLESSTITVPSELGGYPVTRIGANAFKECQNLKKVTIPDTVTSIGSNAFYRCTSLWIVDIPDSVMNIGDNAFYWCESLQNVAIPDSVMNIGNGTFEYCRSLTNITFSSSVTNIGNGAFSDCDSLTSVNIPSSVTSIGKYAFLSCDSLKSVYITDLAAWCRISFGGSSANPLGCAHNLYLNGTLVKELTIPNSITNVKNYAFNGWGWNDVVVKPTSVTIPKFVKSIGDSAFRDCDGISNVTIPSSVANIGPHAFYSCDYLRNVTINNGVTSIGAYAFYGCSRITNMTIPVSVTTIGKSSFSGCSGITNVTMKGDCPSIGTSAFYDIGWECKAWLPNGNTTYTVTNGEWQGMAVKYYNGLYSVTFDANGGTGGTSMTLEYGTTITVPTVTRDGYVFNGWSPNVAVTVPASNVTYKAQWKARQYTVTFDANGGTGGTSTAMDYGTSLSAPIVTRLGYTFSGWVPSLANTVPMNDVTYVAQWRLDESKTVIPGNDFWLRDNAETGWFVDSGIGDDVILRSGQIGNNTNSWMETTIIGPASFSFDWKVSCNTRGHYLAWFIDGVEQARIRGETDWASVAASVPDGEHVVRFDYVKGSTAAAGEDKGQVRNLTMGLRVDTETMQVTWDWTTNYWVECSVVGKGATSFEAQWVADGTNLVIPFSVNTPFYSLSLSGDAEEAVIGDGSITVPITSPRSIVLNVTEYVYGTALDSGSLPWMAGGTANWVPQGAVSHDGQDAVRSGEVTGDDVSTLSTVVVGPGTLSWWWKLDMADCVGVDVFVDGAFVESLDSASDWASASVDIVGNGEHIVRFEFWNAGTTATISDCAYLDQVSWTGGTVDHTVTTPEPVPYSYFDMNCPTLLAEYGGDYEVTAFATALNGRNKVWECYVAGISPTNATAQFMTKIEMKNGAPIVTWEPDLNINGIMRTYKVYGSETLEDGGDWQYPTNFLHRFFKVKVEMP